MFNLEVTSYSATRHHEHAQKEAEGSGLSNTCDRRCDCRLSILQLEITKKQDILHL